MKPVKNFYNLQTLKVFTPDVYIDIDSIDKNFMLHEVVDVVRDRMPFTPSPLRESYKACTDSESECDMQMDIREESYQIDIDAREAEVNNEENGNEVSDLLCVDEFHPRGQIFHSQFVVIIGQDDEKDQIFNSQFAFISEGNNARKQAWPQQVIYNSKKNEPVQSPADIKEEEDAARGQVFNLQPKIIVDDLQDNPKFIYQGYETQEYSGSDSF